jgi:hypothetical protein
MDYERDIGSDCLSYSTGDILLFQFGRIQKRSRFTGQKRCRHLGRAGDKEFPHPLISADVTPRFRIFPFSCGNGESGSALGEFICDGDPHAGAMTILPFYSLQKNCQTVLRENSMWLRRHLLLL